MSTRIRGSKISRMIAYFKESELEEARIVWTRVNEIMSERVRLPKLKRAPRRSLAAKMIANDKRSATPVSQSLSHSTTAGGE